MATRDVIIDRLRAWQHAHNTLPEEQIYRSDAVHAEQIGLPTIAVLCRVLDRVAQAQGPLSPREVESELRRVLTVAVGEGTERVRLVLGDALIDGVPGVPMLPAVLLERLGADAEAQS